LIQGKARSQKLRAFSLLLEGFYSVLAAVFAEIYQNHWLFHTISPSFFMDSVENHGLFTVLTKIGIATDCLFVYNDFVVVLCTLIVCKQRKAGAFPKGD